MSKDIPLVLNTISSQVRTRRTQEPAITTSAAKFINFLNSGGPCKHGASPSACGLIHSLLATSTLVSGRAGLAWALRPHLHSSGQLLRTRASHGHFITQLCVRELGPGILTLKTNKRRIYPLESRTPGGVLCNGLLGKTSKSVASKERGCTVTQRERLEERQNRASSWRRIPKGRYEVRP